MPRIALFLILAGAIFAQVVAEVNDSPVTLQDLKLTLQSKFDNQEMRFEPMMLKEEIDRAVDRELIYVAAKEKGYSLESDPDIKAEMDAYKKKVLIDMFIQKEILPSIEVTDEELQREYKGSWEYYKPVRYRAAVAEIHSESANIEEIKSMLSGIKPSSNKEDINGVHEQIYEKMKGQEQNYFIDIRDFREDEPMMEEIPQIKTATPGQVIGPVGTEGRQMIFTVIEKLPDESTPLEQIKSELIERIRRRKLQGAIAKFVEEPKSTSKISIDNGALSNIK